MTHPAAATADNFKNWRLAILLNGFSFDLNTGLTRGRARRILVQLLLLEGFANGSHFQLPSIPISAFIVATETEWEHNELA